MSETVFDLQDVHYAYLSRFPALCGVSLRIGRGEKVALVGANGTGKSTLLQMLDGLVFPDRGRVSAFGAELTEAAFEDEGFSRDFRRRVGFVFQNPEVQLFCPSVREDILFGPLNLGVGREQALAGLARVARDMDIEALLDRAPHQLSIGEKRKVAIASVWIMDPEVMILDEPTAGLDPLTSRHIVDGVLRANREGKTLILSTHDLHILEEVSDTVYVLDRHRRVARRGNALEILADRDLLHENNLVHVHRHSHDGHTHTHVHAHPEGARQEGPPAGVGAGGEKSEINR